ncbi:phosphoribosyltransferase [Pontixanthobacter sp. CEM42]|uniref:phosphoribosyltransferase n=1 Tax=Pontixanthobacter sp. CEM42 TaxID=2792077 RepID=UPI001AE03E65|nr:phosphoribosyltransferase [Pontixanthobacter sp. CEM42]
MKFPVMVSCGYPSYREAGLDWGNLEYNAWKLVKAIKGQPVNGYAEFGNSRVDGTPGGRNVARRLVANDAVQKLRNAGLVAPLVAVPSSDHVDFEASFTGHRIAQAITAVADDYPTRSVLRFREVMPKAAGEGGTREPSTIAAALDIDDPVDFEQCILVDDVTTSGGHLRGAARFLRERGISVIGAYCVAQTVWTRPAHLFRIPAAELDSAPAWFEN